MLQGWAVHLGAVGDEEHDEVGAGDDVKDVAEGAGVLGEAAGAGLVTGGGALAQADGHLDVDARSLERVLHVLGLRRRLGAPADDSNLHVRIACSAVCLRCMCACGVCASAVSCVPAGVCVLAVAEECSLLSVLIHGIGVSFGNASSAIYTPGRRLGRVSGAPRAQECGLGGGCAAEEQETSTSSPLPATLAGGCVIGVHSVSGNGAAAYTPHTTPAVCKGDTAAVVDELRIRVIQRPQPEQGCRRNKP